MKIIVLINIALEKAGESPMATNNDITGSRCPSASNQINNVAPTPLVKARTPSGDIDFQGSAILLLHV